MPKNIQRDAVQRLLAEQAPIIDVLPPRVYRRGHLPGAINIPLTELNRSTTARLDKEHPVVVYCYDFL